MQGFLHLAGHPDSRQELEVAAVFVLNPRDRLLASVELRVNLGSESHDGFEIRMIDLPGQ